MASSGYNASSHLSVHVLHKLPHLELVSILGCVQPASIQCSLVVAASNEHMNPARLIGDLLGLNGGKGSVSLCLQGRPGS